MPGIKVGVRGISNLDDALKAADFGASAIWLTEKVHSRSAMSPISLIHNIGEALANLHPGVEVFMQGGVRRGTDILKSVALGAKAVFLDLDTVLWGLVRDGNSQGLADMLTMLNEELKLAMVLTHSEDIPAVKASRIIHWI